MKYGTYLWLFQKPLKKPLNWRNPTSQICSGMRSEGKKRTLELSLIQGFSKIEKLFGGATRIIGMILSESTQDYNTLKIKQI